MRILTACGEVLLHQRGHLFPWVPVFIAVGIGAFFTLKTEPLLVIYGGLAGLSLALVLVARFSNAIFAPMVWAVALIGIGLLIAGLHAHRVAEPVIGWRYYGPVEGRIVGIDRSSSDAIRLTLDHVVLRDMSPDMTPAKVRISLHGDQRHFTPAPGVVIMATANLAPPGGPVEPGGFDFQRHAWFMGLGALGYTRVPVLVLAPAAGGQVGFRARMALSTKVQTALPGDTGGFAAAIMTGDRSGMGQETLRALRISNLAHLLAISGLHMGLLAGFIFGLFRLMFAAVPWLALRLPAKKVSAVLAMIAAAGYLVLSGGNVATERAFVMVAVALAAVLADRRVFSLRGVAVAAIIVLCLTPDALLGPGFQMSFAATSALVAVFGLLRDYRVQLGPPWMRAILTVVISSGVAGLATAPVAAVHFNQIAHYGLLANLISVPLMGVLVMPLAVLAAFLLPFGLEGYALWVMGLGLDWILGVAHWVTALDGARGTIVTPDSRVLPLMGLGFLVMILWQGRFRLSGLLPVLVAVVLWINTERPDVLIADGGALVGILTPDGRALSKEKGAGFVAQNWLENDGDAANQQDAAQRWTTAKLGDVTLRHVTGKKAAQNLASCTNKEWIVLNAPGPKTELPCQVFDPARLRATGSLALYLGEKGEINIVSAREVSGQRLWNTPRKRPRRYDWKTAKNKSDQ